MTEGAGKKKILFLITKSNWGGAQRYVYDLATALPKDAFQPVVLLGGNGTLKEKLDAAGIRTINIPGLSRNISLKKEILASWHIGRSVWSEQPDILHVNSSKAGGVGTLIGRLLFVPRVVFTAHGWAFNEDRPMWQRLLIKFLHWLTVVFSHRTIAVSNAVKKQMDWPFVTKKMTVIHPGREIDELQGRDGARAYIAAACNVPVPTHDDPWIATIAELHPIKRLHLAVEAVSMLVRDFPQLRYIIIGHGELHDELSTLIREKRLGEHVFLAGAVPEASCYLPAFDIFVLSSKSESYGYVLAEAGLAGVPIVATDVGGITDILHHEETGLLVPPDDAGALAAALRRYLSDPPARAEYAAALKAQMQERTIARMTEETIGCYERRSSASY